jgi:beta-aspartyl-dipeptidase (metallo-type)
MLTIIENAAVYAPEPRGHATLVIGGGKLLYCGAGPLQLDQRLVAERMDVEGAAVVPGFIDAHVHVTGGGGEDGFSTQALPVPLSGFTSAGVTSVVGLLGTDDETRSTASLVARTRALREEGLSAWCWTGGYHLPATTLTGSIRRDIVSIDCIIGCGELAISDHRSSQPVFDELARVAADVHVAGLIARKAGVLHLHLGDGERGLELVRRLLDETELPARVFHPTHVNRRRALFDEAVELATRGVTIDLTAFPVSADEDAWSAADGWERYRQAGAPAQNISISSDGGGCLPVFDQQGQMLRMGFATSAGLTDTFTELLARGHALDDVLPAFTSNLATLLRLPAKGRLHTGLDADLQVLDSQGRPAQVMALGQWMVRNGQPVIHGTFE